MRRVDIKSKLYRLLINLKQIVRSYTMANNQQQDQQKQQQQQNQQGTQDQ